MQERRYIIAFFRRTKQSLKRTWSTRHVSSPIACVSHSTLYAHFKLAFNGPNRSVWKQNRLLSILLLKTHDYGVYRLVAGQYSIYELTGLASWKVPTNKQRGTCEEKTMNTGTSINLGEWMKTYGFSLSIAMTHGNITWGQAKQKAHEQKRQKERRISC